ncbi:uncharacterized protein LOC122827275 isoform X3 [Gambusia affinis]|uniref:uncharacterized protein LOC122827275 isoform X3 n=1 Tax=Gambusia affinis TaxID=33528 RepID=UPI001CDD6CDB|nr:uncharacterized protein LOC122827275 isoform X3 [Gambusia affinis]
MLKFVLLFLTLSGLQARPIAAPGQRMSSSDRHPVGFKRSVEHAGFPERVPDGFRQGTEPTRKFLVDLKTGLVKEHISEMERRVVPVDVPAQRRAGGWVRVEKPSTVDVPETQSRMSIPAGFRQGTEPKMSIPVGFRQGTQPKMSIPVGFRQGTQPKMSIPVGFRQGTEPEMSNLIEEPQQNIQLPVAFRLQTEPKWSMPVGFRQGTEPKMSIPVGFRQGTEPKMSIPVGFRQGTQPKMSIPVGFRQGTEPEMSNLIEEPQQNIQLPVAFRLETEPKLSMPVGFRQGTEPKMSIPVGFRQGTEPKMSIPVGFRQGTEPKMSIPVGFRQGTEPEMSNLIEEPQQNIQLPVAFRLETEPKMSIPVGFRQGTEPKMSIPVGFRQGTEPKMSIPVGFRQGTEPKMSIPVGFRQGTEPEMSNLIEEPQQNMQLPVAFRQATRVQTHKMACNGEMISGKCYEFNPNMLSYKDAQAFCRNLAPDADLASITNRDLHSRLVSLVTKGGGNNPVLTWLGGIVKNQQASWVDGSKWSYSDWMPGHPNIHADKPACVEMFKIDESWWSVADCELKRASLCSYPVTA